MKSQGDVIVVGAGVVGLTTGIRLAEAGHDVLIRAAAPPQETTSARAGAIWGPFLADDPRVPQWSFDSLRELVAISKVPASGVEIVSGVEAARDAGEMPPWFARLPAARPCTPDELPAGYSAGWRYDAPVVDMPAYLRYLEDRYRSCGGRLEIARIESLETVRDTTIVVNCTGLGSRELVGDGGLYGLYGQLVIVENPGVHEFFAEFSEDAEVTYFMPQGKQLVLGGTIEPDRPDASPGPDAGKAIIARCARVQPLIAEARVTGRRGALRPCRPRVRLERVAAANGHVIHNYGHGGSGISASWACADAVASMVHELKPVE